MATDKDVAIPEMDLTLPLTSLKAQVAMELAAKLSDAKAIRERYGISDGQWEVLRRNPTFRTMVVEAIQNLQGDLNSAKRVKLKAGAALEDSVLTLYAMAHDPELPAAARIEAIKVIRDLSGFAAKEGGGQQAGPGFSININFSDNGANERNVTLEGKAIGTDQP